MNIRSRGGSSITYTSAETLPGNTLRRGYTFEIPRGVTSDAISPLTVEGTVDVLGTLNLEDS